MLGTGLRVGELTGLRWCDVDFENKLIKVDHGLVFVKPIKGKTKGRMKINGPKTYASIRDVPIIPSAFLYAVLASWFSERFLR